MGPATRIVRILFSAILGALIGALATPVVAYFAPAYADELDSLGFTDIMVPTMVALILVGAAMGACLGARKQKRTYYDEG